MVLLRLIIIHWSHFRNPRFPQLTLSRLVLILFPLLSMPQLEHNTLLSSFLFDVIAVLCDSMTAETRLHCVNSLNDLSQFQVQHLQFILGFCENDDASPMHLAVPQGSAIKIDVHIPPDVNQIVAFPLRRWEMVQDATPAGGNDTSLSLGLFAARRAVL